MVYVDGIAPTLPKVTIRSNNSVNHTWAALGDEVTITITADEALLGPTSAYSPLKVSMMRGPHRPLCQNVRAAKVAEVSNSAKRSWTAKWVISNGDRDCTKQTPGFEVTFADLNSNAGKAITSTTDASAVDVDTVAPKILKSVISTTNKESASRATAGDLVSIRFTADEEIRGVSMTQLQGSGKCKGATAGTFNGPGKASQGRRRLAVATTVTMVSGWKVWTANRTLASSDVDCSGQIPGYTIQYTDMAGNPGKPYVIKAIAVDTKKPWLDHKEAVKVDTVAPTTVSVNLVSDNADKTKSFPKNVLTLTFVSSEAIITPVITLFMRDGSGQCRLTRPMTVSSDASRRTWTAKYTVQSNDQACNGNSRAPDKQVFQIVYRDFMGNDGNTTTATTDKSSVTLHNKIPELISVKLSTARAGATFTFGDHASHCSTLSSKYQVPKYQSSKASSAHACAATVMGANLQYATWWAKDGKCLGFATCPYEHSTGLNAYDATARTYTLVHDYTAVGTGICQRNAIGKRTDSPGKGFALDSTRKEWKWSNTAELKYNLGECRSKCDGLRAWNCRFVSFRASSGECFVHKDCDVIHSSATAPFATLERNIAYVKCPHHSLCELHLLCL